MHKISLFIFTLFALFLLLYTPLLGTIPLSYSEILSHNPMQEQIFYALRLPRTLLSLCAGALLALSGLLFQTLFRNDLMTPFTLGISSGATLGVGIAIKFALTFTFFGISAAALFGFMGAAVTIVILFIFAQLLKKELQESLLLLGVALSFFYNSALMILLYLSSMLQTQEILRFTFGSLNIIGYTSLPLLFFATLLLLAVLLLYKQELHIFALSNEQAHLRGVDTKKTALTLLLISSLSIGILISITGPIGFVGLIIPHIVKNVYKKSIPHLIIPTAIFGGLFLVFCDTLARLASSASEVPIGVVTALIGAPFFIYLILKR